MELILEGVHHAFEDTWLMLPLLYIAYCVIEYFERKDNQDDSLFFALQKYGPLIGALIGLIPQCGFSILAAMLFVQNNITIGTLLAVFIATSDEAIPILLSEPRLFGTLGLLLVCKFLIAIIAEYFVDGLIFKHQKIARFEDMEEEEDEEWDEDEQAASSCPCCYPQYPLWLSALIRSVKIYLFIFIVTFIFTILIHVVGEATLSKFLLTNNVWQPVLAAIFGFIPNCAATVVLCQLFALGQLSFGSLLSGLITNAGLGFLVLFQYGEKKKTILTIALILWIIAVLSGMIASLFF
ncbi:putative manganese transporter [Dubosiella newyorkensis]|uniref:putative manganese transporter n=1 Tax=Dubosiella newyorkensis TaxID=1862672 RepID=UPI00272AE7E3|nr:putative manganese transporter [Dubosiella newyorkensis]